MDENKNLNNLQHQNNTEIFYCQTHNNKKIIQICECNILLCNLCMDFDDSNSHENIHPNYNSKKFNKILQNEYMKRLNCNNSKNTKNNNNDNNILLSDKINNLEELTKSIEIEIYDKICQLNKAHFEKLLNFNNPKSEKVRKLTKKVEECKNYHEIHKNDLEENIKELLNEKVLIHNNTNEVMNDNIHLFLEEYKYLLTNCITNNNSSNISNQEFFSACSIDISKRENNMSNNFNK
jgi:hypothetical protein